MTVAVISRVEWQRFVNPKEGPCMSALVSPSTDSEQKKKNSGTSHTLFMIGSIIAALVLAWLAPAAAVGLKLGGEVFLRLLMMVVVPLVMASVMSGILGLGDVRKLGKPGLAAISYYLMTTILAVGTGVIVVNLFAPGEGIDADSLMESTDTTDYEEKVEETKNAEEGPRSIGDIFHKMVLMLFTDNLLGSMVSADLLPLIVFSIVFAGMLTTMGTRSETIRTFIVSINDAMMSFVMLLMKFAPIGIFCLVAASFGKFFLDGEGIAEATPVVDAERDTISYGSAHGVRNGAKVAYRAEGHGISGLEDGRTYFAVRLSGTSFQLAASEEDAMAFEPVVMDIGKGTQADRFVPEKAPVSGWQKIASLGSYVATVMVGLGIHFFVTLPLILWVFTRRKPIQFYRAMSDAILTAFSTASSSATLPVTMECAEVNAGVSRRSVEFVLPLGATINMDGTALYEAAAAIFMAQIYAGANPDFVFGFQEQLLIAVTATLAAIGAAGIPEAGLVTMLIVLNAVGLPTEYLPLILPIDWLLDRFRTATNAFGDSVGAAVVDQTFDDTEPAVA